MIKFSVPINAPTHDIDRIIEVAATHITRGEVLIFPTETIYGIGCSALQGDAIDRVFTIKERPPHQAPPVLIGQPEQLSTLVAHVPAFAQQFIDCYWPGSLTLILPARDELCDQLCGWNPDTHLRTVGVRLTGHVVARALCAASTPIIATSANISGAVGRAAAPQSLEDIPLKLQNRVECILDGGVVGGQASTVVDCSGVVPHLLREGAVRDVLKTRDL